MFSVNLAGLESTVFWGAVVLSRHLLAGKDGLSFPAGKLYQGERCGEGETEKPPNSGIASNRAAKKGYTSPMLFYLLIKTNSQIKRISLYRHCTLCQNREKQKASRYRH